MKKDKSIQKKLFANYFVLILGIVLLFLGVTLFFVLKMMSENASQSMKQIAYSVKNEVEMEMDKANSLQKRILFSEQFKEVLFAEPEQFQGMVSSLEMHRKLNLLSDTVCGPDEYRNFQMNYWNSNGGCSGVGYNVFTEFKPGELSKLNEFQKIVDGKGKKVLSAPTQTEWAKNPVEVISMYRLLEKADSDDYVVIETQMNNQNIRNIIEKNLDMTEKTSYEYQVLIYNGNNEMIYASKGIQKSITDYMQMFSAYNVDEGINYGRANSEQKRQIFTGMYSKTLDWNIWVMEEGNAYIKPLQNMAGILLLVAASVILFLWLITYTITKQFVKPILEIHKKMKKLDLNKVEEIEQTDIGGDIEELRELNGTFNQMCVQLKDSKEKLQIAHENEVQSRLLAMQAQMNPHFLYNILSIIKIMGKEVRSQGIVNACTELSMMLRYISSSDKGRVTIEQEEKHSLNYLELMKTRFQTRLEYDIEIPSNMKTIRVPRLILQPLVENSIKYATEGRPPWKIFIKAWIQDNKWYLTVRDNGPGIDEDKKEELEANMKKELIGQHSASIEIGGMGILNIYSRLVLIYGDDVCFKLSNHLDGGLEVTIGGIIDE